MATNTAQINPPARHISQQQIVYLRRNITFNGNLSPVVGSIPAGAIILPALSGVVVTTGFNAGTTNTLAIGTSGNGTAFASALALGTAAFVAISATSGFRLAADTIITAAATVSGTAATTGDADVIIAYIENQ
ncbi:hypothetical protein PH562_16710 [Rhizobium sp. CNPSo 4062]|uniref:hypothetical protein n=1 Tax=Rhizobium sp. CNPSo 4062 TaxID=3021410 RepID=UPI00254CE4F9|nr:hypothetical protein [Rhizobium sp. CNPSo 4062]MDK4703894.1 hypothetical protein [Rhizobium sp. CNPSo 4062]